jgi:hypothetical protein
MGFQGELGLDYFCIDAEKETIYFHWTDAPGNPGNHWVPGILADQEL